MGPAAPARAGGVVPVVAVTVITVVVAWTMLLLVEPGDHDGIMGNLVIFVVLPLAGALCLQFFLSVPGDDRRTRRAVLGWALAAIPGGVIAAFAVDAVRDPEYYLQDGWGPAVLMAVFVWVMFALCGALVWFFLVWPVAGVVSLLRLRRTDPAAAAQLGSAALVLPVVVFVLGVGAVVAGISIDPLGARVGAVTAVFALLGIPGAYEITWAPGLWIVRGILVLVLALTLTARANRRRRLSR